MAAEVKLESNNSTNHCESSYLRRSPDSLRFLYGLATKDQPARALALDSIVRAFDSWIEGYGSPKELVIDHVEQQENNEIILSTDFKHLITEQLPDLLRLSLLCPFADVRERCANILEDLKVMQFGIIENKLC